MDDDNVIEFLRATCDDELRLQIEKGAVNFDDRDAEVRFLLGRNKDPIIRNVVRPIGEFYAVIAYDSNHILKLVKKPKWHGFVPCLVMWDFVIIDIDDVPSFHRAKKQLLELYPKELFYAHRTPRGYHIYLMSRLVDNYHTDAIMIRMTALSDPAHGTNSLYSGSSIRLCRKPNDTVDPSIFVESFGGGECNSEARDRYNLCLKYLELFGKFYTDKLLETEEAGKIIYDLHKDLLTRVHPADFGLHHVISMAPFKLALDGDSGQLVIVHNQKYCERDPRDVWHELVEKRDFPHDEREEIIASVHRKIQMRNLYRILDSTSEYALGIHVQESLYFISYKNLLMLDYDTKEELEKLKEYMNVMEGTSLIFRIVETKRGYHCFLTNKKVCHDSDEAYWILRDSGSDLFHSLGSMIRGYSVRLNRKHDDDFYREVGTLRSKAAADAEEDPELVELYNLHLVLFQKYSQPEYPMYNSGKN